MGEPDAASNRACAARDRGGGARASGCRARGGGGCGGAAPCGGAGRRTARATGARLGSHAAGALRGQHGGAFRVAVLLRSQQPPGTSASHPGGAVGHRRADALRARQRRCVQAAMGASDAACVSAERRCSAHPLPHAACAAAPWARACRSCAPCCAARAWWCRPSGRPPAGRNGARSALQAGKRDCVPALTWHSAFLVRSAAMAPTKSAWPLLVGAPRAASDALFSAHRAGGQGQGRSQGCGQGHNEEEGAEEALQHHLPPVRASAACRRRARSGHALFRVPGSTGRPRLAASPGPRRWSASATPSTRACRPPRCRSWTSSRCAAGPQDASWISPAAAGDAPCGPAHAACAGFLAACRAGGTLRACCRAAGCWRGVCAAQRRCMAPKP
jgi:hypothetical protein